MAAQPTPLFFPEGQNYDCVMCGRGCESKWTIPADDHVVDRLQTHPLGLRVIDKNGAAFARTEEGGYVIYYADPEHPSCGFLNDNKLCEIHAELGMDAKPTTCQQFPFHATATPDGVYVGVSFFCTSVRENSGRPLQAHEDWLRDLMARGIRVTTIEADEVPVSEGVVTQWSDFKKFEAEFKSRSADQGLDLTAQQALVLVARSSGPLAAGWDDYELDEPPLSGQLESMLGPLLYAICKLFLDDTTPERIGRLDEAFAENEGLDLFEFNWTESWMQLLRFQDSAVGERFEDELERWAHMQIHRKSMLVYRPLLDNLWMFVLLPRVVRLFTALFAHKAGHPQAESSDYYAALEIAEMYLGTNGLLPSRLAPRFTALLRELL